MAHGGKRAGAGRPKGRTNKVKKSTRIALAELAREHTDTAITTLVAIAKNSESDAARVSAAIALLDRAYGKPWQAAPYEPQAPAVPDASQPAAPVVNHDNVRVFNPEEIRRLYGNIGKKLGPLPT